MHAEVGPITQTPLTPLSFLKRSAHVYRDRLGVTEGSLSFTYGELGERSRSLAGALRDLGVEVGDRVAVLSPNSHVLLEAHFGVPGAGAVLVAVNNRLAPVEVRYILEHSQAKVLVYDKDMAAVAQDAAQGSEGIKLLEAGEANSPFESLLSKATPYWAEPSDELTMLSINYTSGTTGKPKGVIYQHRGAFLQALAMAFHTRLGPESCYLWTLPMFHTNGWCFPWAVTAAGARHRCLRRIDPTEIWRAIREEGVTHLCAAPTVLLMVANHPAARDGAPRTISVMTGGAPPTPTLLERLAELRIEVIHLYGLTETYGPAAICEWRPEWSELPLREQAQIKARQGVGNIVSEGIRIVDDRGTDVPADATTLGEITIRGNNVMAGYFRDPAATQIAIRDGWFRTGDLAVMHPDGYVEIRDRRKDIIISGGENISSVEVERALTTHPAVLEAAVVGRSDDVWGEVPIAVVELQSGQRFDPQELIDHVKSQLAHFKAPRAVYVMALPRTSTGKVQKHVIRRSIANREVATSQVVGGNNDERIREEGGSDDAR
ncbi:MAG: AMP-binding protein [Acidimicrobiia bacterium]